MHNAVILPERATRCRYRPRAWVWVGLAWPGSAAQGKPRRRQARQAVALRRPGKTRKVSPGFEKYWRQIKPGQFYTAIHLTIWAVQNGPGMLNRNKTGLTLLFWTGLDLVRWKLVFRTDFEKHSLDYRRKLKPGQFCTTLLCRMVRPCRMVRASKIVFEREWGSCFGLFWTKLDTNSYLGPILKGTMANNHENPNPDVSA